jgi:hypothetical protein
MTYCAQIPDLLPQAQQTRQDLNDPTYCDGFDDPEQCRKNLGAQKQSLDQEIARLQAVQSSCATVSTLLTGTWHLNDVGTPQSHFTIDVLYNDGSWSGKMTHVLDVADNTIIYGLWNGATLEISFQAPQPFNSIDGKILYYYFSGHEVPNTQPLAMIGRWDMDLGPGVRESQQIRTWSARKVPFINPFGGLAQ